MGTLLTLVILLSSSPLLAQEHDKIAIDLMREWTPAMFSPTGVKATLGTVDLSGEFAKLSCDQPDKRASFEYAFHLPIEMSQYPMLTLKYRAHNIATNNTYTCLWIVEGHNYATFPLIDFEKLTVDDQVHEVSVDLPKAPMSSKGTPFESGLIEGITVSVLNDQPGLGWIELMDLSFASADAPAKKLEVDQPLRLRILKPDNAAVKDASIVVDAERKDAAKSGTTDANGGVTLTPMKNEVEQHAVEIIAPGLATMTKVLSAQEDMIEIVAPKGMQLGGFVRDEQGNPIENAQVTLGVTAKEIDNDRSISARSGACIRTD